MSGEMTDELRTKKLVRRLAKLEGEIHQLITRPILQLEPPERRDALHKEALDLEQAAARLYYLVGGVK